MRPQLGAHPHDDTIPGGTPGPYGAGRPLDLERVTPSGRLSDRRPEASGSDSAPPGLVVLETSTTQTPWDPTNPQENRRRRLSKMRRAVRNTADLVRDHIEGLNWRYHAVMVTPTYRDPDAWSARHMSDLTDRISKWAKRGDFKIFYVWVAELTKAGRVHYHLVVWLPTAEKLPKADDRGWWPHGMTRTEACRNGPGYLMKYLSKGDDGQSFPKGLRLHGRGGLTPGMRLIVGWWLLPRYVREHFTLMTSKIRRKKGGGWEDIWTGEWLPSWTPDSAPS